MPPKPEDHDSFYAELTARNHGLVASEIQSSLRTTRFVVAGCGSTGGAVLMPLVRTGAECFVLFDPGDYELNNLNRQDAALQSGHFNDFLFVSLLRAGFLRALDKAGDKGLRNDQLGEALQGALGFLQACPSCPRFPSLTHCTRGKPPAV